MVNDIKQLWLLLWKNFRLQLRSPIGLLCEILAPALFAIILLPIRTVVKSQFFDSPTVYTSFPIGRGNFWFPQYEIAYAPNNSDMINEIMRSVQIDLTLIPIGFNNEEEMVVYANNKSKVWPCLGGVTFLSTDLDNFKYKIRLSHTPRLPFSSYSSSGKGNWRTQYLYPPFPLIGPRNKGRNDGGAPGYSREGFIDLQQSIDMALISRYNSSARNLQLHLQRHPYPEYVDDPFINVIQLLFPFIIMLSYIVTVILSAKAIVYEKETGIKESMRLMGMKTYVYWLSWFIKTYVLLLPSIVFMAIAYKIKLTLPDGNKGAIIEYTDPFIFTVFLLLYSAGSITFMFMCTTFFKKANSAAAGTGIIWFVSYLPFIFIQIRYEEMSLFLKTIVMFINNLAMSEGIQLIGQFEGKGTGVTFENWTTGPSTDDNFSMISVLCFLFFNNIIHMAITLYVDTINPGYHGIAKPWYYPIQCCLPQRYCRVQQSNSPQSIEMNGIEKKHHENGTVVDEVFIEDESIYSSRNIGIKITNLFKIFKQFGKVKAAVNNLSMNVYENHITVLLGHNGAGKSTTISMITGLSKPTSGKILINGIDIVEDTKKARKVIGFCPQHNLLFDDLTVYEHLKFFAQLKNNLDESEIDSMLDVINLADKKHALSKTLSGGMKRKLSVAIAFIGKSSIVILDEPSSGMDPQARHSTWSLLQKFKKERKCTILLTTHFMDEADVLGDRIAIMSKGSMRCCGSPLYLKSKYNSGYDLVLTKRKDETGTNKTNSGELEKKAINLIQSIVPEARLNENLTSEMSFVLPTERTPKFSELFQKLESERDNLNINDIGISISTLEDVFLKINEDEEETEEDSINKSVKNIKPTTAATSDSIEEQSQSDAKEYGLWIGSNRSDLVTGSMRIVQQFVALLYKRYVHAIRNKALTITQIMIPIGVMVIQLLYLKFAPLKPTDMPALEIDLSRYRMNYVPYQVNVYDGLESDFMNQLANAYKTRFDSYSNAVAFDLNQEVIHSECNQETIDNHLICLGRKNIIYLVDESIVSATFEGPANETTQPRLIGHFNNQAYHVPPLTLNFLTNTLLKVYAGSSSVEPKISVINHPLPRLPDEVIEDTLYNDGTSFNVASGLTFGFSFLVASFVVFVIKEKTSNARHIQFLSGCSPLIYWTNALFWDFVSYLIPTVVVVILLWGFDIEEYINDGRWVYTFFLLFVYGLAHIPQMYLLSFFFKVSATGLAALTAWNVISSQATFTSANILMLPDLNLTHVGDILETVFVIFFPNYSVGQGIVNLYTNKQIVDVCNQIVFGTSQTLVQTCLIQPNPCCKYANAGMNKPCGDSYCLSWTENLMSWGDRGLLKFFVFMLLQFVVQFAVLVLYDGGVIRSLVYALVHKRRDMPKSEEIAQQLELELERVYGDIKKDDDVIDEEVRIGELVRSGVYLKNDDKKEEIFIVDGLTKYYSGFMAVKGISFALKQSECFGLLGVNGAGKTTTFKMITGDETITRGDAFLNKVNLKKNQKKFQSQLGYCPQFDPLIDQMTVYETMRMYAHLRGIKPKLVERTCLSLISLLDLDDHVYKMCKTLSGGNKRKLSVAIALVGSPSIVLLDEPTSGMDPKTRRGLWNCLNLIRNRGKSLILTTHGMDETEVLCTNIGIMVNGELKCLGSLQHLKSKYGEGYTLLAKIKLTDLSDQEANQSKVNAFTSFILDQFRPSTLKESRDGFINIHISNNKSTALLSSLFSAIENCKDEYGIEYYVVTQTKLEQIFLNFASKQIDPESRVIKGRGICSCFTCASKKHKMQTIESEPEPDILHL